MLYAHAKKMQPMQKMCAKSNEKCLWDILLFKITNIKNVFYLERRASLHTHVMFEYMLREAWCFTHVNAAAQVCVSKSQCRVPHKSIRNVLTIYHHHMHKMHTPTKRMPSVAWESHYLKTFYMLRDAERCANRQNASRRRSLPCPQTLSGHSTKIHKKKDKENT